MRREGVLRKNWEIANMSKFMQSGLFKLSEGLGYVRDLTRDVKQQKQINMKDIYERD